MISIRAGSIEDFDVIIALMDEAVAWLAEQGRTGQWGSEPFSTLTRSVEYIRQEVEANDLWIAEIDGGPVGAMLLGEAPTRYVEPVEERELFLHLLVTSRRVDKLAIETVNGASVLGTPLGAALGEAGFLATPRGLRLRG